jgi:hypothetical protein
LLSLGFLRRMGPWCCQFGGWEVVWRLFILTVKAHSLGPEVALGKWLNLLEEAMIAVCWRLFEMELCSGLVVVKVVN